MYMYMCMSCLMYITCVMYVIVIITMTIWWDDDSSLMRTLMNVVSLRQKAKRSKRTKWNEKAQQVKSVFSNLGVCVILHALTYVVMRSHRVGLMSCVCLTCMTWHGNIVCMYARPWQVWETLPHAWMHWLADAMARKESAQCCRHCDGPYFTSSTHT